MQLKHSLENNGYVILDSISYGNTYHKSKQDNELLNMLKGKTNDGLVDDNTMSWQPLHYENLTETNNMNYNIDRNNSILNDTSTGNTRRTRQDSKRRKMTNVVSKNGNAHTTSTSTKRFYSNNVETNVILSLQRDILHYSAKLDLDITCIQINASVHIMLQGCEKDKYHFNQDNGYVAIYPFFPNNKEFDIHVLKVSTFISKLITNVMIAMLSFHFKFVVCLLIIL